MLKPEKKRLTTVNSPNRNKCNVRFLSTRVPHAVPGFFVRVWEKADGAGLMQPSVSALKPQLNYEETKNQRKDNRLEILDVSLSI